MFSFLLYAVLIWFAYKFIVGLVIPVFRTTRQVKKQFRTMQEHMQSQQGNAYQKPPEPVKEKPETKGDYIDFEEVK